MATGRAPRGAADMAQGRAMADAPAPCATPVVGNSLDVRNSPWNSEWRSGNGACGLSAELGRSLSALPVLAQRPPEQRLRIVVQDQVNILPRELGITIVEQVQSPHALSFVR